MLPELKAGVYRHYKGPLYLVFGYGHDANIENRDTVQYVSLELNPKHTGPRLSTRTAMSNDPDVEAWFDYIHPSGTGGKKCLHIVDGVCENGFEVVPRYEYLGPTLEPEFLPREA